MERTRISRFLRTAVTALCLTGCVLLIALWVRSLSVLDEFHLTTTSRTSRAYSFHGELKFVTQTDTTPGRFVKSWGHWSENFETDLILPPMPEYASLGFSLTASRHVLAVGVPTWFSVLLSAILAATPWISWSRRFSLRTLPIATTLVAVVLGTVVLAR